MTLTALVRRMRVVRVAAAARTTAGAETVNSRRWCSPRPSHLVRELDLVEKTPHALVGADGSPAFGIGRRLSEAVDPELHAF